MAYTGIASTPRVIGGLAANPHNLFTIWNGDSVAIVKVRRLTVQLDATAALAAVMPQVKSSRISAAPTGGSTITKGTFDSAQTSNSNVKLLGAASTDQGAASVITATAVTNLWQQYGMCMYTTAGQVLFPDFNCLPTYCESSGGNAFKLKQNEGLLVSVTSAATSSNPATTHWIVNCMWEEA